LNSSSSSHFRNPKEKRILETNGFLKRLAALPRQRTQLLPALLLTQEEFGFVSDSAVVEISSHLRLTLNDVEGVVTAYPELRRAPAGRRIVRVCTGPACLAAGGQRLLDGLTSAIGIRSSDASTGGIALEETACCFCCAMAPVLEFDGRCQGRLSSKQAEAILHEPTQPTSHIDFSNAAIRRDSRFLVGAGSCGIAVGAREIMRALRQAVESHHTAVEIVEAGCTGMDGGAVQVTLQRSGRGDLFWSNVRPEQVDSLVAVALGEQPVADSTDPFAWNGEQDVPPFVKKQTRVLLEHVGRAHPTNFDEARGRGRYTAFELALQRSPEDVIAEVERSGLTGRGGAYFPVAAKWKAAQSNPSPRYLVVNAEEGEPGVFKDRHLLEGDPHLVIEGMLIAAYAIGANKIVVYLNGHAHLAHERLAAALAEASNNDFVGEGICGSAFSCDVELRSGGGGYVLGEESVILESIEGRRPMPRVRPPFPVTSGLFHMPTVINNVESLANVPLILSRGANWFRTLGSEQWPGTKLICVSGDVVQPGLVEVEIGTPLRKVVEEICGGVPGGRSIGATLAGGPSGVLAPPTMLEAPLEPRNSDVLLGSGNLTVFDDRRSLLELVRRLARFNAEESCGKCTPCREGVTRMHEIVERLGTGDVRTTARQDLLDLCEIAASASLCGHGQMAPNPIRSALERFSILGV
jgi:NADH:ubiquinone oxidoreductase subunit F (NADH-binding)/NADH:ubiquinone oxidoreductase subunit E